MGRLEVRIEDDGDDNIILAFHFLFVPTSHILNVYDTLLMYCITWRLEYLFVCRFGRSSKPVGLGVAPFLPLCLSKFYEYLLTSQAFFRDTVELQ